MPAIKPAGFDPFANSRDVRRGVIEAGAITRGQLLADAKREIDEQAIATLQAAGNVAGLDRADYARAKRQALSLLRRRP